MARKTRRAGPDPELGAINVILDALDGLESDSIQRVLDYVIGRLSIPRAGVTLSAAAPSASSAHGATVSPVGGRQVSVRDLKDQKQPTSANQMAALVAYYLAEVAPSDERKEAVNAADLQRYFKQAGFRLPKSVPHALPNAAAAGYLEAIGNGMYRLNPVGYNLIAHGLPRGAGDAVPSKKQSKKK